MLIIRQRELNFLVNGLFFTRIGRFCAGGVLLLVALYTGVYALDGSSFQMKTGTLAAATEYRDAETNAYRYTTIQLAGDSATYTLAATDFSPSLPARFSPTQVRVWYVDAPFHSRQVVAIDLYTQQAKTYSHYTTQAYTDPGAVRNGNLIAPIVALVAGIVFLVLALRMRRATYQLLPVAVAADQQEQVDERIPEPVLL